MARRPLDVIIDTDPGIDDACALLAALASPRLRVRAVIATGGNVPVRQAAGNVRRVLAVARPAEMPLVGLGLEPPGKGLDATCVHGPDGLAQAPVEPLDVPVREVGKVVAQVLAETEGSVSLLALAPLTTVRWMLGEVPDLRGRLEKVVVMGGATAVPGNASSVAEFNFWRDPEAAAAVIHSGLPVNLVPLDVTNRWLVTEHDLRRHLRRRTQRQRVLRHLLRYAIGTHRKLGHPTALVHDAVALTALVRPSALHWKPMQCDVEVHGVLTRGMLVSERRPNVEAHPNVSVATGGRMRTLSDVLWRLLR